MGCLEAVEMGSIFINNLVRLIRNLSSTPRSTALSIYIQILYFILSAIYFIVIKY